MKKKNIALIVWVISAVLGGLGGFWLYETSYDIREWFRPQIKTPILMILFGIIIGSIVSALLLCLVNYAKKSPSESTTSLEKKDDKAIGNAEIEEIMGFKKLLDAGIITEEEFEAKRKEILKLSN